MRLTCPNCDAQYEVDGSLIPPAGRDVQCSNCGTTWFQEPEGRGAPVVPPPPETPVEKAPERVPTEPTPEPEPVPESVEMQEMSVPAPAPEPESVQVDAPEPAAVAQPRPKVDDNILGILREEAEREIEARRRDTGASLETQPDLGLDAQTGEQSVHERTARLRGEDAPLVDEVTDRATRGALLPNIEEINSTLTPAAEDPEDQADFEDAGAGRRGFRLGFALVVVLIAILILTYLFAPALSSAVPALEGPLSGYVAAANGFRLWLDGVMGAIIGLVGGPSPES
ncbi:MAG: zinc-ribbon domain-containing protein [Pseudomonadota bacterium]